METNTTHSSSIPAILNLQDALCIRTKSSLLLIFLIIVTSLSAVTWNVRQDGSGDFTAIQPAIDASADGDTVLVHPGRYYENVEIIERQVTLASLEMTTGDESYIASTIIDGNQSGSCIYVFDHAENVTLRGLSITNGSGHEGSGGTYGGGILISYYCENASVINCSIYRNSVTSSAGGLMFGGPGTAFLSGCSIRENSSGSGGGIWAGQIDSVTFDSENRCSIYNNYAGNGSDICVNYQMELHVVLDTCTVLDPYPFFASGSSGHSSILNPFTFDIQHAWMEEVNHDLYVSTDGDDRNSGQSEAEPLKTISWAMHKIASDSLNPKTVHVAAGEYSTALNDQILPIPGKTHTRLIGDGIGNTVIRDTLANTIVRNGYYNHGFHIADMTLSEGSIGYAASHSSGISLKNIAIENCHNTTVSTISAYECADLRLNKVFIRNNTSEEGPVGPRLTRVEDVSLEYVVIENNEMLNLPPNTSTYNNTLCVEGKGEFTMQHCIVRNNIGNSELGMDTFSIERIYLAENDTLNISIDNCLFCDNDQRHAGAASGYVDGSAGFVNITNSTFSNNTGRTILKCEGKVTLQNNILWNPDQLWEIEVWGNDDVNSSIMLQNNCIRGGLSNIQDFENPCTILWQDSNITGDPALCCITDLEYTLSDSSPCIDAGISTVKMTNPPQYDLGGNERVWDGDGDDIARIDMGCYEYQPILAPVAFHAELYQTNVRLSWEQVSYNRSLVGYKIWRDSLLFAEISDPDFPEYLDVNVPPGNHVYWVTATYGVLDSDPTESVSVYVDSQYYTAPVNLFAQQEGLDVVVTWQMPENRDLTGFNVYRDSVLAVSIDDSTIREWLDIEPMPGIHSYQLSALYGGVESPLTEPFVLDVVNVNEMDVPEVVMLVGNAPNPFNPSTTIRYAIPHSDHVKLEIFNVRGQKVVTLVDRNLRAGYHSATWQGLDQSGKHVSSGVYMYRLVTQDKTLSRKMLLLK